MKKIIIAIVAVLFIAIVSPKFIGQIVETEHQSMLENINEQVVTVKSKNFTRSWFGAKATTEIIVHLNNPALDDFSLTINENLSFGPVIFAEDGIHFGLSYSDIKLDLGLENDEKANEFLNNNIHLSWLLSFASNVTTYIAIDEYVSDLDYKKVIISPASGQFTMTANNRLYGDFNWQGITLSDNNDVILKDLSFALDQELIRGSYADGDAVSTGTFSLMIDELEIVETNNKPVANFKGISFSTTAKEIAEMLQIGLNYHVNSFDVDGQHFEQANIAIKLEKLDIETMQAFSKIASKLDDKKEQSQIVLNELTALAGRLIAKEPVLKIEDVSVLTPQGKIVMLATAQFDKNKFDAQNMMTAMVALQVNGQVTAPVAFFAEGVKKNAVDMYLQQGLLIQEGEQLKSKITFKDGKLTINDNVIPL